VRQIEEVAVRQGIIRLERQRLPAACFGLGVAAQFAEGDTEIEQRFGQFGLEL
jgi:hypothetical protein